MFFIFISFFKTFYFFIEKTIADLDHLQSDPLLSLSDRGSRPTDRLGTTHSVSGRSWVPDVRSRGLTGGGEGVMG